MSGDLLHPVKRKCCRSWPLGSVFRAGATVARGDRGYGDAGGVGRHEGQVGFAGIVQTGGTGLRHNLVGDQL